MRRCDDATRARPAAATAATNEPKQISQQRAHFVSKECRVTRDGRHISSWPLHTSCARACDPDMTGGIIDIHLLSHGARSEDATQRKQRKTKSKQSRLCPYQEDTQLSLSLSRAFVRLPRPTLNDNIYPSTEPSRHIHHRIHSLESALRAQRVAILHRNRPIARRTLSSGPCLP